MGATTTYGWIAPNLGDPANGPAGILAGLQDVEDTVKDATILTYTPSWSSDGASQPGGASILEGRYRVDHGLCFVSIRLWANGSTTDGRGNLFLTLPLPANATAGEQDLNAKLWVNTAGGGLYRGHCDVNPGSNIVTLLFPASAADVRMNPWRNADASGAVGTSIPLVSGNYAIVNGSNCFVFGHYFV